MAKDKLQKRKEALARQRESLMRRIAEWTKYMAYPARDKDEETTSVYDAALVQSAYAARCDRYGNYLDYRFYKDFPSGLTASNLDPATFAYQYTPHTIEEMKNLYVHGGMTLYRIAYGTLSDKRKERDTPPYDINDVTAVLAFLKAGEH